MAEKRVALFMRRLNPGVCGNSEESIRVFTKPRKGYKNVSRRYLRPMRETTILLSDI